MYELNTSCSWPHEAAKQIGSHTYSPSSLLLAAAKFPSPGIRTWIARGCGRRERQSKAIRRVAVVKATDRASALSIWLAWLSGNEIVAIDDVDVDWIR